jgi:hypothetical protein
MQRTRVPAFPDKSSREKIIKLAWYEARDTLLGQNNVNQDVKRGMELAAACEHPETRWLTELFAGKKVDTIEEAQKVFLEQGEDDAKSLCFRALILKTLPREPTQFLRSAQLGFALAQACIAQFPEYSIPFAEASARQGERDGFSILGYYYEHYDGEWKEDLIKAKQNLLMAAELGDVRAMSGYACLLDESDPNRWHFWALAGSHVCSWNFLEEFPRHVEQLEAGIGDASVVFAIGQALKKHVNFEEREILKQDCDFDSWIGPATVAIGFYKGQCCAARAAVDTWTVIGLRNHVVKDIRIMIAKLIWELRDEAEYEIDLPRCESPFESSDSSCNDWEFGV